MSNANATKQIESTGQVLTIAMREHAARRSIVHKLAMIEQQLWTLGDRKPARLCLATIESITDSYPNLKEPSNVSSA